MALTGHAEMASSTSASGYSGKEFTQESPFSSSSKTSPAIAAHAQHPMQEEFTWGFLKAFFRVSRAAFTFDVSENNFLHKVFEG